MKPKKKIRGYACLTFRFQKEDGDWVADCVELGTSTFSHTLDQAERHIKEAVKLNVEGLAETGELDRFFKKYHIRIYSKKPAARLSISRPPKGGYLKPVVQPIPSNDEPVANVR